MSLIDLHCHSTHSDGTMTPEELVKHAESIGITGFAITDHDAISAYDEAKKAVTKLKMITGVELSTTHETDQVHVLGYAFTPNHEALRNFCSECRERRLSRNREILDKLEKKGIKIEESEIMEIGDTKHAIGRPHIALALMKKGYVQSLQEAFQRYIGEGKSCYVPGKRFSVLEAIDAIHAANGKAVIAHPHLIKKNRLIQTLLEMPFDGLEAYYSKFSESVNQKVAKLGSEKGWLLTGGSDFHGANRPEIQLRASNCPEETFDILWNHFQRVI